MKIKIIDALCIIAIIIAALYFIPKFIDMGTYTIKQAVAEQPQEVRHIEKNR